MENDHLCLILEQQTILERSIVMQTFINKVDKLQPIQVRIDLKHYQITFLAAARGAYIHTLYGRIRKVAYTSSFRCDYNVTKQIITE